jgi:hypothetical protein
VFLIDEEQPNQDDRPYKKGKSEQR